MVGIPSLGGRSLATSVVAGFHRLRLSAARGPTAFGFWILDFGLEKPF
jgi:hypothetical protein